MMFRFRSRANGNIFGALKSDRFRTAQMVIGRSHSRERRVRLMHTTHEPIRCGVISLVLNEKTQRARASRISCVRNGMERKNRVARSSLDHFFLYFFALFIRGKIKKNSRDVNASVIPLHEYSCFFCPLKYSYSVTFYFFFYQKIM